MNRFGLIVITVLSVSLLLERSHAMACDLFPNGFFQEPRVKYTGLYRNEAYGYIVMIPNHVAGYDGADAPRHNGFGIALGEPPQSYILVQADPNSLDDGAAVDAALRLLSYLRRDAKNIESVRITPSHLGTLEAAELVVTYTCPGSARRYTMAAVFGLGPAKSPVFEVSLDSPASRYRRDRVVLDQLLKSWKYTGR